MAKPVNRNLALLLGGQFVSQIGDKFYALALAFWVLQTTGSAAKMGVVLFASMVPSIVLGFFIGGIIDRYSRKMILVAADVLRGLVVTAVIVFYYLGMLNLGIIVAAQVLLSAASAFFNPSVLAVVPRIVDEDKLVKANSTSQFLGGTANIVGPMLGGLAVSGIGYQFVFAVNALAFFFSALCEGMLKLAPAPGAAGPAKPAGETLRQGYAYIMAQKKIVLLLGVVAVVHFFAGSVQIVMPVLANALPGDGAQNLGYIESAFGLGIVAAALMIRLINPKGKKESGMFGGLVALGIVQAAAGLLYCAGVVPIAFYLAAFFLLSASVIVISTNYTVILQQSIDNTMAGRVFGIVGSVGNFTLPAAVLLFGCIVDGTSLGVVTAVCGAAILLICTLVFLAYRIRNPFASAI